MRFMLFETKAEKIALTKELSYIEKYIELQKIRTTNSNYVKYEVKGDAGNLQIEPMLFIPFICMYSNQSVLFSIKNLGQFRF